MGRHLKLKEAALACGIAFSLAQQSGIALAFTQEPVAPPSSGAQLQTPEQQQLNQQQNLQGQISPNPSPDALPHLGVNAGTELKIPGIGSVGTLPKLDFGLELLYGPKSGADNAPVDPRVQDGGDVQIKGTFTHKF